MFVLTQGFLEPSHFKANCLKKYLVLNKPSLYCSFVDNSSHHCHSDGSITADYGAQSTQSLGHKGAPLTGLKPQANKVGTLPKRRDTGADGKCFLSQRNSPVLFIQLEQPQTQPIASILCQMVLSTIHFTAHTPALKSLHNVGPRMNSSWAAAASDPSEECMVTVSTLERQHMASWSGTASTSNRATLSRGSHKRPGTDPSLNGHKPANSTEKREHCECPSSWACDRIALRVGKCKAVVYFGKEK